MTNNLTYNGLWAVRHVINFSITTKYPVTHRQTAASSNFDLSRRITEWLPRILTASDEASQDDRMYFMNDVKTRKTLGSFSVTLTLLALYHTFPGRVHQFAQPKRG